MIISDYIDIVFDPNISFMRFALIAGVLASVAAGIMGSFVVVRRLTYLGTAIAHASFSGIGLSLLVQSQGYGDSFHPVVGAMTTTFPPIADAMISAFF